MTVHRQAIAIVDPLSTGGTLATEAVAQGYEVIAVWDRDIKGECKTHVPICARGLQYYGQVDERQTIRETADAVRAAAGELELVACITGFEAGVHLGDALSQELGLRTNGVSAAHRDKKIQQEIVRAAGLRSVRQAGGKQWSEVQAFIESEQMPVVLKPTESAGSDGVKQCHSMKEAEEHFHLLTNSQRKVGSENGAVLCQEFLRGKEYVVDHVSRDGVHKTTMIWVYDKRPANGAAFVYYGLIPVEADSAIANELVPYVRSVLDALEIKNGPTHGEVIMTPTGPCLVEMNCRAHGGDGAWVPLARALTGGYTQVDCTLAAFADGEEFQQLPDRPPSPFLASGQEVDLVSFQEGRIVGAPGWQRIRKLDSFVSLETTLDIGCSVRLTEDIFSSVGCVVLMHQDPEVVRRDVAVMRQMELNCELFEVEPDENSGSESSSVEY